MLIFFGRMGALDDIRLLCVDSHADDMLLFLGQTGHPNRIRLPC